MTWAGNGIDMNIERMLNMVIRMVMRRLLNKGIGAGINAMSKNKGNSNSYDQKAGGTSVDPQSAAAAKDVAKRARQAARLGRRL
jgi:hypothetical protein